MSNYDQLNTGNSGQTFGNEEQNPIIEEAIATQQLEIAQLMPQVDQIIAICEQEIATVSDIRSYITTLGDNPDALVIAAEYRARELYIQFLNNLKSGTLNQVTAVQDAIK